MKLILLLAAIIMAAPAQAQRRAIMENLYSTNNAIFISSTSSVYVRAGGSFTVAGTGIGVQNRAVIGSLTLPTTTQLDVYGLIRMSAGITTMGGDARGSNANDLQVIRAASDEVASGAASVIGGGSGNKATGASSSIGGGLANYIIVSGDYSTISGGDTNTISSARSTIGGGNNNTIGANTSGAVISGGNTNALDDVSDPSIPSNIAGGKNNSANNGSAVGGGRNNSATNTSTVAGGFDNDCTNQLCFIGGGQNNESAGSAAVISGGNANVADGQYSVVPGGSGNKAYGIGSTAAGTGSISSADGAYTLTDSAGSTFNNGSTDTYKSRFAGGYGFDGGASTFTAVVITGSESPASNAACVQGKVTWDANYVYVCTATAVWKRSALTGGY